jgi:anti-anti-sigma factor
MNLECSKLSNDVTLIKLTGALDIAGVGAVETTFYAHCAGTAPRVVVDLAGVDFISSLGIRMLLQALKAVAAREGRLLLLNPTKTVDAALDISGLGPHVVRGSTDEASAALLKFSN